MYILAFCCSAILVLLLIPPLRRLALAIDFVDRPNKRKIHKEPVPHLASIAMFAGFFLTYLLFHRTWDFQSVAILIGSSLILSIGLVDDWYKTKAKDFPAWPKALIQVTAAVVAYCAGIAFTGFTNPFTQEMIVLPGWLQFVLTILWIFGVTTVINFMDGLDGLSGGIATISAMTLFIVALTKGQTESAVMAIALVGVSLGYLRYNRPPAAIYMGDAGATLLGYLLGIIALDGAFKQATVLSLLIPMLTLGVPIFDNLFVVIKRIWEGKPFYQADRSQIHYRLLKSGLNPAQSVLFICLISTCLSLSAIIILLIDR